MADKQAVSGELSNRNELILPISGYLLTFKDKIDGKTYLQIRKDTFSMVYGSEKSSKIEGKLKQGLDFFIYLCLTITDKNGTAIPVRDEFLENLEVHDIMAIDKKCLELGDMSSFLEGSKN